MNTSTSYFCNAEVLRALGFDLDFQGFCIDQLSAGTWKMLLKSLQAKWDFGGNKYWEKGCW